MCKSTAAEREASRDLLSSSALVAANSPVAMATQAIARNTAIESGSDVIPPIPVKIPTELDFSLPPNLREGSATKTGNPSVSKISMEGTSEPTGEHKLIQNEQVPSHEESDQRWINTKALIPNSVYSPPTTK